MGKLVQNKQADWLLIQDYLNGNENSLSNVWLKYEKLLLTVVLCRVKNNFHDAEDILQDVFIKVKKQIDKGSLREGSNIKNWLITVTVNYTYDQLRKQQKNVSKPNNEDISDSNFDYGEYTQDFECNFIEILEAIKKLPELQKEVVEMRLKGIAFKDIAEMKNISINTAIGRMRYALMNIRKKISIE